MIHKKEDFIVSYHQYYRCICADKEVAVFARVIPHRKDTGYKTKMTDLFVTGQTLRTTLSLYARFYRGNFTSEFPNPKKIIVGRKRVGNIVKETYGN